MTWQWRSWRSTILLGDLVLHIAVFLWIMLHAGSTRLPERSPALSVIGLAAPSAAAPLPATAKTAPAAAFPTEPPPVAAATVFRPAPALSVEQRVESILGIKTSALVPAAMPAAATTGVTADICDLTPAARAALLENPDAIAAMQSLPRATLSVANAYMLWDKGWVAPRLDVRPDVLDPVHKVLIDQVAAAPQQCRDQPQVGPRLVTLGTNSNAITLVIGSGTWHWGDLALAGYGVRPSAADNRSLQTTE